MGVEPTRDMFHRHARRPDSRHGHTWSTRSYSKTHAADYESAALPLELRVQKFAGAGRYRLSSYAGPLSVIQILPPFLFSATQLPQEGA
jgi:hypothetical protein